MAKAAEEAAQEKSRQDEPCNASLENESVDGDAVIPTLCDIQEMDREPKYIHQLGHDVQPLGLSSPKLVIEQEQDVEMLNIKKGALSEIEAEKVQICYFVNSSNVLMRKWRLLNVPASNEVYQIMVPPLYRRDILVLTHDTPLAGHLGVEKMYHKVLGHFYWPGLHGDVKKFVKQAMHVNW